MDLFCDVGPSSNKDSFIIPLCSISLFSHLSAEAELPEEQQALRPELLLEEVILDLVLFLRVCRIKVLGVLGFVLKGF